MKNTSVKIDASQEQLDLDRLYDTIDRIAPLAKKFLKKQEEAANFGQSHQSLTETRHALLDLLFSVADDLDWLTRMQAFHEEEKAFYIARKRAYKNSK
jgi:hypothetical protein